MTRRYCRICHRWIRERARVGRKRHYCSDACRQKADRLRLNQPLDFPAPIIEQRYQRALAWLRWTHGREAA